MAVANTRSVCPRTSALLRASARSGPTCSHAITDAASAFVGDVNAALTVQLAKLLDTSRARAVVPPMPGLDVTIESAAFAQDGSRLTVHASGRAAMTSAAFASFLGFIGR